MNLTSTLIMKTSSHQVIPVLYALGSQSIVDLRRRYFEIICGGHMTTPKKAIFVVLFILISMSLGNVSEQRHWEQLQWLTLRWIAFLKCSTRKPNHTHDRDRHAMIFEYPSSFLANRTCSRPILVSHDVFLLLCKLL